LRLAKAHAIAERRDYVLPDDVRAVAVPVLAHRLLLGTEARTRGIGPEEVIVEALAATPAPL
ncbi:MAG: AAA family ATPase, partial [Gaiella sp.]